MPGEGGRVQVLYESGAPTAVTSLVGATIYSRAGPRPGPSPPPSPRPPRLECTFSARLRSSLPGLSMHQPPRASLLSLRRKSPRFRRNFATVCKKLKGTWLLFKNAHVHLKRLNFQKFPWKPWASLGAERVPLNPLWSNVFLSGVQPRFVHGVGNSVRQWGNSSKEIIFWLLFRQNMRKNKKAVIL